MAHMFVNNYISGIMSDLAPWESQQRFMETKRETFEADLLQEPTKKRGPP